MKIVSAVGFLLIGAWALAQTPGANDTKKKTPAQSPAPDKKAAVKAGPALPPAKFAFDKKVMADYIRHLVPYPAQVNLAVGDPKPSDVPGMKEVTVRAWLGETSEEKVYYVSNDGKKIMIGSVFDVTQNPFKPQLDKLKTASQPNIGTPGAPVVLVMFSDFQCPYCRDEAKTIREKLIQQYPKEVRLYYKDFPLTQIHPWAKDASVLGRCVFKQKPEAFWAYFDWIYENQGSIDEKNLKEKTNAFFDAQKLDRANIAACVAGPDAVKEIESSMAEGRDLGVTSTPTLFVNGRIIPGSIRWESLQQLIDIEVGYQRTAKNAGEACCTVTLDPLGSK